MPGWHSVQRPQQQPPRCSALSAPGCHGRLAVTWPVLVRHWTTATRTGTRYLVPAWGEVAGAEISM